MPEAARVQRLEPPVDRVRVVIDTDAANEVDDQFAVTYAALSPERLAIEALYAAPFQRPAAAGRDTSRPWFAPTPAEGMAHSHAELRRVVEALGDESLAARLHAGAEAWLPAPDRPVPSPAAEDLVARARQGPAPLYVVALGAPTNVASALVMAPELVDAVVVVWLGGNGTWWSPAAEFNVYQDRYASRVLLDSGVPLVHVPCRQVTEKLTTTPAEIDQRVRGRGAIGDYLADTYDSFDDASHRAKQLWDVGAIAWLTHPEWCPSALVPSPRLLDDLSWGHDPTRHLIREVRDVDPDAVFDDLFDRLPSRS